ncbi:MAG: hypothetical protein M3Y91_02175 [Actinomycetota bacterium]|nr:hypothetical protein [Actinomycetota bacterium]
MRAHRHPRWRKAGTDEGFCVRGVAVRRLNLRWATLVVPKIGPVRFRLSRACPPSTVWPGSPWTGPDDGT